MQKTYSSFIVFIPSEYSAVSPRSMSKCKICRRSRHFEARTRPDTLRSWRRVGFIIAVILFSIPIAFRADAITINSADILSGGISGFSGAQHFYSVLVRGNGEAVVGAKLIFENDGTVPLTEYSFKIKNAALQENPVFIQELRRCKSDRYSYSRCRTDESPDYAGYSYDYNISFISLHYKQSGNTFTVTLAEPIPFQSQGAILMRYRSFGYTSRAIFGRRQVAFETFDVNHELRQAQVSVSVDSDLHIKGGKGQIAYKAAREDIGLGFAAPAGLTAESSSALERFSSNITQGGQITKFAKELADHETFKIKATYAASKAGLYWSQILIAALVLLTIVIFVVLFSRRAIHRRATVSPSQGRPAAAVLPQKGYLLTPFAGSILMGLANAVVVLVASYFVPSLFDRVERTLPSPLILPLALLVFVIFVAIIIGPSFYYGHRYGKRYGYYTFGFLVVWLIVGIITLALILDDTSSTSRYLY